MHLDLVGEPVTPPLPPRRLLDGKMEPFAIIEGFAGGYFVVFAVFWLGKANAAFNCLLLMVNLDVDRFKQFDTGMSSWEYELV